MSFIPRTARIVSTQAPAFPISRTDVFLDQLLEFLGNPLALQGHGFFAIHVDRRDPALTGPGKADADIGVFAFAGPVDDAAHDRDVHVFDSGIELAPLEHLLPKIALDLFSEFLEIRAGGPAAARASDDHRRERAQ